MKIELFGEPDLQKIADELLPSNAKRAKTLNAHVVARCQGYEFWDIAGDVYRCKLPILKDIYDLPSDRRWECTRKHLESYRRLGAFDWLTFEEPLKEVEDVL